MSDNVLEIHDVAVMYDGRTVLEVSDLAVRRGEIMTLLGENGSGKTTLLRLLGLLIRPASGSVVFGGEEVDFGNARRLLELRRSMAAVMQEPLLCRMSVRRNVALGLRFRGLPKSETERRVNSWLERLSISHLAGRPAAKLSGGEAQRTSLARAMVLDPDVLFLDEPFAALDAPTRQAQLLEFQEVLAESGVTAVFATHDRGEAIALSDRLAVLVQGKIAQVDSPETIFSRPAQEEVARFLGVETLIPGRVADTRDGASHVDCGEFHIEAQGEFGVGDEVLVAVRPENITLLAEHDSQANDVPNVLQGRVTKLMPAETHYRVEIDCGVRLVAVVSRNRLRILGLQRGDRVQATFSKSAAHLIKHEG